MSEADKMFEELGYKKETHISRLIYKRINVEEEYEEDITFFHDDETIDKSGKVITMPELNAINKKIEELRSKRLWD
jgi:hypothetical protein